MSRALHKRERVEWKVYSSKARVAFTDTSMDLPTWCCRTRGLHPTYGSLLLAFSFAFFFFSFVRPSSRR